MADLPRYRPLGAAIASMPSVNYIQTGSIEAQKYEQIDRSLGRISDYLYEQEVARAKVAGAKYGAEKAPTIEQLSQAREFGRDISGLVPGDDTVFGMAARKSALSVIESQMEIAARQAITQLRIEAEEQEISADDFQAKLNGLLDGYSTTLSQINPISARNFEAAMAATANSNLLAHAQDIVKKNDERYAIAVELTVQRDIFSQIGVELKGGITYSEFGDVLTPQDRIDILRDSAVKMVYDLADSSKATALLKQFDDRVIQEKQTYLTDWATESPRARYRELRTGSFSDPHVAAVWETLDDPQKAAARDAIRQAEIAQNQLITNRESIDQLNRKKRVIELLPIVNQGIKTGEDVSNEIDEIVRLDPDKGEQLVEILYTKGGVDNADTIRELDLLSLNNDLTVGDVLDAVADRKLTATTANRYFDEITKSQDQRFNAAKKILADAYQNPESIMSRRQLAANELERYNELSGHLRVIYNKTIDDPKFDPLEYANQVVDRKTSSDGRKSESDKLRATINKRLDGFGTISQLQSTELRIEEAKRLIAEDYVAGGLFTTGRGLPPERKLILQDILVQLNKLREMEMGQ